MLLFLVSSWESLFPLSSENFYLYLSASSTVLLPTFVSTLIYALFQLWVGPGSRAAEEKQFFDSHLAPFYRIEQVLLYYNFFYHS